MNGEVDVSLMLFAASYTRQVHDWIAEGRGPPELEQRVRMADEALAVADGGLGALRTLKEREDATEGTVPP